MKLIKIMIQTSDNKKNLGKKWVKKFQFSSVSARKLKCPARLGSARHLPSSARLEPENSSSGSSLADSNICHHNNGIFLHSSLNPVWHFWLSTRFSCCLKMKSVENILGYIREQFYRFESVQENTLKCSKLIHF